MISTTHLLAFVVSSFVLIAIPGPSVLFTVGRALVLGRRGGIASAAGNAVGAMLQALAVAFGLGAIVERSIVVFTILKFAGAAYLIYLGVQAIRHRKSFAGAAGAVRITSARRAAREAFVVGLTNPKVIVFFAAVLPQFIDPAGASAAVQMVLFGAVFTVMAFLMDSCWAVGAGTAREWFARSPGRLGHFSAVGGVAMIGLGARVAVTGRHD
ncbi:LysE family translocator [Jiangella rhizosphaerae]|uniref:LysE family translocator n=1 Tax=Jiangella rhizosphaerae TaxID=2293569 RepID=A0A418KW78_9ACTN|nr:LysE family translocator [Jiangella rhizosphaerae]RIQ34742.1 LysE family translocator [Jiangella rhizosphaerae]